MLAFLETRRDLGSMRDVNYGNGRKIKSCDRRGWPPQNAFSRTGEERIAPLRFFPLSTMSAFVLFLLVIALMDIASSPWKGLSEFSFFFPLVRNWPHRDSNPVPKISSRAGASNLRSVWSSVDDFIWTWIYSAPRGRFCEFLDHVRHGLVRPRVRIVSGLLKV